MSTTISFVAEEAFSKAIDNFIAKNGFYQSKSEFVRAAVREKLEKNLYTEEDLAAVDEMRKRLQAKAKFMGYPSQEERDAMATEFIKSHSAKKKQ